MNQIALPTKGHLQALFFWIGMYCLALCFSVFVCMSVFYTINSKHSDDNKKSTGFHQTAMLSNAILASSK